MVLVCVQVIRDWCTVKFIPNYILIWRNGSRFTLTGCLWVNYFTCWTNTGAVWRWAIDLHWCWVLNSYCIVSSRLSSCLASPPLLVPSALLSFLFICHLLIWTQLVLTKIIVFSSHLDTSLFTRVLFLTVFVSSRSLSSLSHLSFSFHLISTLLFYRISVFLFLSHLNPSLFILSHLFSFHQISI